ncbi:transposase [Candidatus Magnetoovum chiemensis]|nr:transposase [Candidatus Magnetoovum chiemensis]
MALLVCTEALSITNTVFFFKHLLKSSIHAITVSVSKKTVKRILKFLMFSWHRVKKKVKGSPDPAQYQQKKEALDKLKQEDEQGLIDLRFVDESGFCLNPYVPYAWQEEGSSIEIETTISERLNVLGLLNLHNDLKSYTFETSITTETVIACIDDFSKCLKKKTVLVIDNASVHTSKAIKAKIPQWQEKGLELFYLPTYSPELNLIEILWRFMKYEWIEFYAYKSWENLIEYVENVLRNFGEKYIINYG